MPDLPFSTYEKDIIMFDRINNDPQLDIDQLKIYPCATVPYTVIMKWYEEGKYKPYAEQEIEVEYQGQIKKINSPHRSPHTLQKEHTKTKKEQPNHPRYSDVLHRRGLR